MKSFYLLATFLAAIFQNTVGQTIRLPLTLDCWDTINVYPNKETFMGKECFRLPTGAIIARLPGTEQSLAHLS